MQNQKRTLGQTKEALEFMEKVSQLNSDQREHLRKTIERLVECCIDDSRHAVLVFGKEGDARAELFTVNCNEMDAAFMLTTLAETFMDINTADAPAKEMFN